MPQSLASVYVHLVFSTSDRRPFLADEELRTRTHQFLGGISKQLECQPLIVGGVEDHVHLLGSLGRTITIAVWVKELKRVSNSWLREQGVRDFYWQSGYGAFSVGPDGLEGVKAYITAQRDHHRSEGFQDEFRRMLRVHEMTWDERYVWD